MHKIDWIGSQLAGLPAVTEPLFQDGWGDLDGVRDDLIRIPVVAGQAFEQKDTPGHWRSNGNGLSVPLNL